MNSSEAVHSLWTCVGLRSQNDYCFSLQSSFSVPALPSHLMLFAASALPVVSTRGRVGLKLSFAALAGGALGLSLLSLQFPAVSSSLSQSLFLSCLLCEALLSPLCDDSLMNFSLC